MKDFKSLEKVTKAIANRRRLAILSALKKKEELIVWDIAERIKLSYKSTSKHLGVLFSAGLVDREQRGLEMWYRIIHPLHPLVKKLLELL